MRNSRRNSIVADADADLQKLSRSDREVTVDDSIYDEDVLVESRTKQVAADYIWILKLNDGKTYYIKQADDAEIPKALARLDPDEDLGPIIGTLTGIYLNPRRLKYGPSDIHRAQFDAIRHIMSELATR